MPTGDSLAYVSADTHISLPRADEATYRRAHTPSAPKPTGLNWDALKPACAGCSTPSGELNANDLCPACDPTHRPRVAVSTSKVTTSKAETYQSLDEDDVKAMFNAPTRGQHDDLGAELVEVERTVSEVAAAAAAYDDVAARVTAQVLTPAYDAAANLTAQVAHAARVLRDTDGSADPITRLLRSTAIAAIEALHLYVEVHPEPSSSAPPVVLDGVRSAAAAPGGSVRQPTTTSPRARSDKGRAHASTNVAAILEQYAAGSTIPEVSQATGHARGTVRKVLLDNGVTLRDDRKTRSGSQPKDYPDDLVAQVRALYVDEELTQAQVADRLGTSAKVVQNVMVRAGIPARPTASELSKAGIGHAIKIPHADHPRIVKRYQAGESAPAIAKTYGAAAASIYPILDRAGVPRHGLRTPGTGADNARHIKDRMAELEVTAHDVKTWAISAGLLDGIHRGLPKAALVEAYAAANATPASSHNDPGHRAEPAHPDTQGATA